MKWMHRFAVVTAVLATGTAMGSAMPACDLTLARGLAYDDARPRPLGLRPADSPMIPVARGESESIVLLSPASAGDEETLEITVADPVRVEIFQMLPVRTATGATVYDVLRPAGAIGTSIHLDDGLRAYLADFEIPGNVMPGTYPLRFDLGHCTRTAQLQVHDVQMPRGNYLVQATIDPGAAAAQIVTSALAYGINSFAGVFPRLSGKQTVYPELYELLSNPVVRYFRLPVSQYHRSSTFSDRHGAPASAAGFQSLLRTELAPYQPLLDDPALRAKLLIKLWDEPVPGNYEEVVNLYAATRALLPDIPLELAEQPSPALGNIADIWTIHIDYLQESDVAEQQAAGKRVLLYGNKLHAVHKPSDAMRSVGWILWRYRLDGYHFWRFNWWNRDPWTTLSSWSNDFDKTGTFVYPAPGNTVFASVRLLSFREGLEDAALLRRLEQCAGDDATVTWLQALRRQILATTKQPVSADLYAARAHLLSRLDTCQARESR